MTDRELLELAAKAAGIPSGWLDAAYDCWEGDPILIRSAWNPLTNDGDALRLAVKLRLAIEWWKHGVSTEAPQNNRWNGIILPFADDHYAATRLAIVRAAAEIGKDMV